MNKFLKTSILIICIINFSNISFSKENFYDEGVKLFKNKKYEDAKFLFERSIVLNPKHSNSYLYLAKIQHINYDLEDATTNYQTFKKVAGKKHFLHKN